MGPLDSDIRGRRPAGCRLTLLEAWQAELDTEEGDEMADNGDSDGSSGGSGGATYTSEELCKAGHIVLLLRVYTMSA